MAYQPSQKLVDYAIIAGIIGGGYVIWSKFFAGSPKPTCPAGKHYEDVCAAADTGLGKWLCNAGRNLLGGSVLDCKDDVVTCPKGYTLKNGQCTSDNPGGCALTDAQCKAAVPGSYLNQTTCVCDSANYTDQCTLGATQCALVPGAGNIPDRHLTEECIFVATFGNRWQIKSPQTVCGSTTDPATGMIKCANGMWVYPNVPCPDTVDPNICAGEKVSEAVGYISAAAARGQCLPAYIRDWVGACALDHPTVRDLLNTLTLYDYCDHPKPTSDIHDCSCGKVDFNNPPGTTCESACAGAPTAHTPQNPEQCNLALKGSCGNRFMAFGMDEKTCLAQCSGGGCGLDANGLCRNDAERCYQYAMHNYCGVY